MEPQSPPSILDVAIDKTKDVLDAASQTATNADVKKNINDAKDLLTKGQIFINGVKMAGGKDASATTIIVVFLIITALSKGIGIPDAQVWIYSTVSTTIFSFIVTYMQNKNNEEKKAKDVKIQELEKKLIDKDASHQRDISNLADSYQRSHDRHSFYIEMLTNCNPTKESIVQIQQFIQKTEKKLSTSNNLAPKSVEPLNLSN